MILDTPLALIEGFDFNQCHIFVPFELRSEHGFCHGTYLIQEDLINVFSIDSKQKGGMKEFISYLVTKYKTNKVQFYCVLNYKNFEGKLKGFDKIEIYDEYNKELVPCLKGTWQI